MRSTLGVIFTIFFLVPALFWPDDLKTVPGLITLLVAVIASVAVVGVALEERLDELRHGLMQIQRDLEKITMNPGRRPPVDFEVDRMPPQSASSAAEEIKATAPTFSYRLGRWIRVKARELRKQ